MQMFRFTFDVLYFKANLRSANLLKSVELQNEQRLRYRLRYSSTLRIKRIQFCRHSSGSSSFVTRVLY